MAQEQQHCQSVLAEVGQNSEALRNAIVEVRRCRRLLGRVCGGSVDAQGPWIPFSGVAVGPARLYTRFIVPPCCSIGTSPTRLTIGVVHRTLSDSVDGFRRPGPKIPGVHSISARRWSPLITKLVAATKTSLVCDHMTNTAASGSTVSLLTVWNACSPPVPLAKLDELAFGLITHCEPGMEDGRKGLGLAEICRPGVIHPR